MARVYTWESFQQIHTDKDDVWEAFIQEHGEIEGARTCFEYACADLLYHEAGSRVHWIKSAGGDGGIDVCVENEDGSYDIYQCKFFPPRLDLNYSRWQQAKESFKTFEKKQGITAKHWYLCMPRNLTERELEAYDKFKKEKSDTGISIELIEGTHLISRMHDVGIADRWFEAKAVIDSPEISSTYQNSPIKQIKTIHKSTDINQIEPSVTLNETVVVRNDTNVASLIKRAYMYLEDGAWQSADEYCERVLDQEPENAQAYLCKLMVEQRVHKQADLVDCKQPFNHSKNYQKVIRFGDGFLISALNGYIDQINERNENTRLTDIYNRAVSYMNTACTESQFHFAAESFKTIPGFKDADSLAKQCLDKAEVSRKDAIYAYACSLMTGEKAENYEAAFKAFHMISGYKDANERIYLCQKSIKEIKAKEEAMRIERERLAKQKRIAAEKAAIKRKKIIVNSAFVIITCIAFLIILKRIIIPNVNYNYALALMDAGDYEAAIEAFDELNEYKDCKEQIELCEAAIKKVAYDRAIELINSGDYEAAYAILEEIGNRDAIVSNKYDRAIALINSGDYEAAYTLLEEIGNRDAIASSKYDRAIALIDSGDYEAAYNLLNGLGYKDSDSKLASIKQQYHKIILSKAQVGSYVFLGSYEQDNSIANGKEDIEWLVIAKEENRILLISRYAIDCRQYNTSYASFTWETSSLRNWLNGTFLSTAFSDEEQSMIPNVTVSADKNPHYSTSPGNSTMDKVFLLSISEGNKYFGSNEARKCVPTAYAIEQRAWTSDSDKVNGRSTCWWWLRSPGYYSVSASYVSSDGSISSSGFSVSRAYGAIRPALWVNIDT